MPVRVLLPRLRMGKAEEGVVLGERMSGAFVEDRVGRGRLGMWGWLNEPSSWNSVWRMYWNFWEPVLPCSVLADVYEESALELPEGQVGVIVVEVGPGPDVCRVRPVGGRWPLCRSVAVCPRRVRVPLGCGVRPLRRADGGLWL